MTSSPRSTPKDRVRSQKQGEARTTAEVVVGGDGGSHVEASKSKSGAGRGLKPTCSPRHATRLRRRQHFAHEQRPSRLPQVMRRSPRTSYLTACGSCPVGLCARAAAVFAGPLAAPGGPWPCSCWSRLCCLRRPARLGRRAGKGRGQAARGGISWPPASLGLLGEEREEEVAVAPGG